MMQAQIKKRRRRLVDRSEYPLFSLPEPSEAEKRTSPVHFVLVDTPKSGVREFYIWSMDDKTYAWYENMSQAMYD